jgi:hypothetical protein
MTGGKRLYPLNHVAKMAKAGVHVIVRVWGCGFPVL